MEDKQKEERIKKEYGDTSRKILEIINKNKEEKEENGLNKKVNSSKNIFKI